MDNFTALKCNLCGGPLVMDESREFAVCKYCGTQYLKSTLREKIQEIRGAVKVEGAVETQLGEAEKERRLKNAYTLLDINELASAESEFSKLTKDFPDDIRVWTGSLTCLFAHDDFDVGEFQRHCAICKRLSPAFDSASWVDKIVDGLIDGSLHCFRNDNKRIIDSLSKVFAEESVENRKAWTEKISNALLNGPLYLGHDFDIFSPIFDRDTIRDLKERSKTYANAIDRLSVFFDGKRFPDVPYNALETYGLPERIRNVVYFLGTTLVYIENEFHKEYGRTVSKKTEIVIKTKKPADQQLLDDFKKYAAPELRKRKLCQHCGYVFNGVFKKVCARCGRPKDY